jgi:hypothetical protein
VNIDASAKPPLLILGAPPRGGNHLLRGLLDNHPQLLLPPDEDYFVRHVSRKPLLRLRGMLASADAIEAFYWRLQKKGHLERVNAGQGTEAFGTEGSIDLDTYYQYVREHHRRWSVDALVENHVEAMARALGHVSDDDRLRVIFCALQPSNRDLSRVGRILARSYRVRGVFLIRDPRAHLHSKLARNPTLNLRRYCLRQNRYLEEIDWFARHCGPALQVRFEELVTATASPMQQVCELAGIEFLPQTLEYTQGGLPARSNSSFISSNGIDQSVISRYEDQLPSETITLLEKYCRPELFWHGDPHT